MKKVIFRCDDIFDLSYGFVKIHELFMKEKIPIVYAVIPSRLSKECSDFLNNENNTGAFVSVLINILELVKSA